MGRVVRGMGAIGVEELSAMAEVCRGWIDGIRSLDFRCEGADGANRRP